MTRNPGAKQKSEPIALRASTALTTVINTLMGSQFITITVAISSTVATSYHHSSHYTLVIVVVVVIIIIKSLTTVSLLTIIVPSPSSSSSSSPSSSPSLNHHRRHRLRHQTSAPDSTSTSPLPSSGSAWPCSALQPSVQMHQC